MSSLLRVGRFEDQAGTSLGAPSVASDLKQAMLVAKLISAANPATVAISVSSAPQLARATARAMMALMMRNRPVVATAS